MWFLLINAVDAIATTVVYAWERSAGFITFIEEKDNSNECSEGTRCGQVEEKRGTSIQWHPLTHPETPLNTRQYPSRASAGH
jgi:hypothetical protein